MKTKIKISNRILSLVLALAMVAVMMPMNILAASADTTTVTGSCGTNATWEFDPSTNTLTISGSGAVDDFEVIDGGATSPWDAYSGQITSVVVKDGITHIGNSSFAGYINLTKVSLPSTLTSIGAEAFSNTALTEISLPEGLQSIGNRAFCDTKLQTVVIPNSVTEIGVLAFSQCPSLTDVKLPENENFKTISVNLFFQCTALTKVTIPSSVTEIGGRAFADSGITKVYMSGNAPTISGGLYGGAFDGAAEGLTVYVSGANASDYEGGAWDNVNVVYLYLVDISAYITGGTVTANKANAAEGETVMLTVTPDDGYLLSSLLVMQEDTLVEVSDTYNFTMPSGNVTITAFFEPISYSVTWSDGDDASYLKKFKYGEVITIPTNEMFEDTFRRGGYTLTGWQGYTEGMTMPQDDVTFVAVYTPNQYTVEFDANGGESIAPVTVTFGDKYGRLPSSAITGLSGGGSNWYIVDKDGNVTDTNIKNLTLVSTYRDHKLFIKRKVLAPNVSITLTVPGGISDGYQYYIPGASQRVLTATVKNSNAELLNYTYQWYKDGTLIEGATSDVLTLDGNVADAGTYKVEVTATLKDGTNIVVTSDSATGSKEQKVKILHAANTLSYDANGGEGGPSSNYTGGTTVTVSKDVPTRENYIFQGWNTKADGSGESYVGADTYTFQNDNGNGGCTVMLYAQWKGESKTVTYMLGNEIFKTDTVEYGKDTVLPAVPEKEGYTGSWDHNGKNITVDTVINAVYTINEYTVTYKADGEVIATVTVEHGKDATAPAIPEKEGYTGSWDHNGKNITADTEINAVYTINKYTVTYTADGEVVDTLTVEHGENVASPNIPKKDGYVGKWDRNNENITADTVINAVYTEIVNVVPDELKTDDKTGLEDTKKQLKYMLDDNGYTDDDKKDIQKAIDNIDDALKAIENVEAVDEQINKLPENITKKDEDAIKAADEAYNALSDYEKSLVNEDTKKALDDAKAALAELNKPADTTSPNTGDNSNMFLWIALLFISGGAIITLTVLTEREEM